MKLTNLSILVTVFVQVGVVSLPLLKDTALHGKDLDNSYLCLLVKQLLETHVVKRIPGVSEGRCFIYHNVGLSDKETRNVWIVVKEQCSYGCAISRKNNISAQIPS